MVKTTVKKVFAIILSVICVGFVFSGCKKDTEKAKLTFNDLSVVLTRFDTDVRPFLSTLSYSYSGADQESLNGYSNAITNLSYEMSESFKGFNTFISQNLSAENEETVIETTETEIKITTDSVNFVGKLSADKTNLSVISKSEKTESVFEIIVLDGGYLAQVVSKNITDNTYTVYQLKFKSTTGTFNIDTSAVNYMSIYGLDVNNASFPSVTQIIYKNN